MIMYVRFYSPLTSSQVNGILVGSSLGRWGRSSYVIPLPAVTTTVLMIFTVDVSSVSTYDFFATSIMKKFLYIYRFVTHSGSHEHIWIPLFYSEFSSWWKHLYIIISGANQILLPHKKQTETSTERMNIWRMTTSILTQLFGDRLTTITHACWAILVGNCRPIPLGGPPVFSLMILLCDVSGSVPERRHPYSHSSCSKPWTEGGTPQKLQRRSTACKKWGYIYIYIPRNPKLSSHILWGSVFGTL